MRIYKLVFLLTFLSAYHFVYGQVNQSEYLNRVAIIQKNINQHFYLKDKGLYLESMGENEKPYSYLWPLCALIQATNESEILTKSNDMDPVVKAIDQYYSKENPAPSYQSYIEKSSRFYDDNQWVAIAYLDAYKRTKNDFYLDKSKEIYRWLLTGYDDVFGGGIYWQEDNKTSKNTCSNAPNILVSLQLYDITKEKKYLDTALLVYNWTNKNLRSKEGIFYDAIKVTEGKVDEKTYTYNTGAMLQANVLLYQFTKQEQYLQEAELIAISAKKHFYSDGKLPEHYWFNAVLLRGYIELFHVNQDKSILDFLVKDAERIWMDDRDERNLLGKEKNKTLIMQAAMLEIYARLAQLNLTKI